MLLARWFNLPWEEHFSGNMEGMDRVQVPPAGILIFAIRSIQLDKWWLGEAEARVPERDENQWDDCPYGDKH